MSECIVIANKSTSRFLIRIEVTLDKNFPRDIAAKLRKMRFKYMGSGTRTYFKEYYNYGGDIKSWVNDDISKLSKIIGRGVIKFVEMKELDRGENRRAG